MTAAEKTRLLHDISFKPSQRLAIFGSLTQPQKLGILRSLSKTVAKSLLNALPEKDLVKLLEKLDPDDATDLLRLVGEHKRSKTMHQLGDELKTTVEGLLKFSPDTAAGLMTVDYIQVEADENISDVVDKFKTHEQRTGRLPAVLVVKQGKLAGSLPAHQLILGKLSDKVARYVKPAPTVAHDAKHRKVIQLFRAHPHDKVVVLDTDKTILGVIYSDDVLQLLHEAGSASLSDFAGVSDEESVLDPARKKVNLRYRWLIINLATAFLAAFTVSMFEATIAKYVLLAVYMPIVAGMGGNAATQTLAVVVRGIALRQIDLKTAARTIKNELEAGFVNGVINGLIVAAVVVIFNNDLKLGIVLALAMVVNLLVAGFFGTMIPLIMTKLGKDPASSATVFITTATDVLGFLTFLGLATLILG